MKRTELSRHLSEHWSWFDSRPTRGAYSVEPEPARSGDRPGPRTVMARMFGRLRMLQWRLTLSYTLVTVGAVLVAELAFLVVSDYILFWSDAPSTAIANNLAAIAPGGAPYLTQTPSDRGGLTAWLIAEERSQELAFPRPPFADHLNAGPRAVLVVVNAAGQIVASSNGRIAPAGATAATRLSPAATSIIRAAQARQISPPRLLAREPGGQIVAAAPIDGPGGESLGILLFAPDWPVSQGVFLAQFAGGFLGSIAFFTLIFGTIGTFFGFLISRWLIRRLRVLTVATNAWSRGDLSVIARDSNDDELGQLARQLNAMAQQLQMLLQSRQELAIVEERQRLARDLHDAVKQQVFATAMQIGAARALLGRDPAAAAPRLAEAERLAGLAQQELNGLIRELRPAALTDQDLAPALQEFVQDWSRRTEISTRVRIQGERAPPLAVEQALFRVAQEALANIARHSGARLVEVHLSWGGDVLTLSVVDDGHGFDLASARGNGLGLSSMRERVEALGGTLRVESTPSGSRVEARVAAPPGVRRYD